ncbi:NB-ARC domain-containing protein [Fusarium albosuccineum]|uniref:NB-ARC domain-containing protein n=1 Tax=Fusarium albosuccineum TaxID=1237068 RepID=A0A8H4LD52_9HYPO|nr:NB-ARC domain-containing protein [Fusarium albosuccineum]
MYGLETLDEANPDDADVDIIFVHGLSGTRRGTWKHADGTCWPKDLLPKDLAKARISLFGYDASIPKLLGQSSTNSLRDHGMALCNDVTMLRLRTASALLISSGSPETYEQALLECTLGVIFMGTPHSGAGLANMASTLARLVKIFKPTNREIISVLKPSSEVLANLQQEFHRMIERRSREGKRDMQLFCFFEELPMERVGIIVERHSATLPSYGQVGIHANHKTMTKFDKDGTGYDRVRDRIFVWLAQSAQSRTNMDQAGHQWLLSKFLQGLRTRPSSLEATQQRMNQVMDLTWSLYGECDEIAALRSLSPDLGALNNYFRRASDHIKHGTVDKLMQDMLLNLTDGCYGILLDLQQQIRHSTENEGSESQEGWSSVVWADDQMAWRRKTLETYCHGIRALNANFASQSGAVVMQKFLNYIRDVQQGRDEVSVLSHSLDIITSSDGESEVVWETLKADLKRSGLSTHMLDKHRSSIVTKFTELLETGSIGSQGGPANMDGELTAQIMDLELSDDAQESEPEVPDQDTRWDLSSPDVPLLAAKSGRLDILSQAIEKGHSLDVADSQGNKAVHLASAGGHVAVVEFLFEQGCDPNSKNNHGGTSIRQALENGHHAVIRRIVELSPGKQTVDARVDHLANTALHYAASLSDEDAVTLLLAAGASPNAQNGLIQTPLHLAASQRDLVVVKSLLDADADVNAEDFWGETAFEVAIATPLNETNKDGIIRTFLEHQTRQLETKGDSMPADLDSTARFLGMESIYNPNSSENVFNMSGEEAMARLLAKQFEINDLAEDIWEAVYKGTG